MSEIIRLCAFQIIISLFFTQAYITCLPAIASAFSLSAQAVQLIFLGNLLLFGLSQFFYGPLSDQYGRKHLLLIGLAIACLGNCLSALALNANMFWLGQCLAGAGAGASSDIPRAILRDKLSSTSLIKAISVLSMASTVATGTAPIAGSFFETTFGRRSVFIFLSLFSLVLIFNVLKTLDKNECLSASDNRNVLQNYKRIFTNLSFIKYATLNCCCYAAIVMYLIVMPFIMQDQLQVSAMVNSIIYSLCACSYFLASIVINRFIKDMYQLAFIRCGIGLFLAASIFILFSSLLSHLYLSLLVISGILLHFASGLITPISFKNIMKIDNFPAGLSAAAISAMRVLISFVLCIITTLLFTHSMTALSCFLAILSALCLLAYYYPANTTQYEECIS